MLGLARSLNKPLMSVNPKKIIHNLFCMNKYMCVCEDFFWVATVYYHIYHKPQGGLEKKLVRRLRQNPSPNLVAVEEVLLCLTHSNKSSPKKKTAMRIIICKGRCFYEVGQLFPVAFRGGFAHPKSSTAFFLRGSNVCRYKHIGRIIYLKPQVQSIMFIVTSFHIPFILQAISLWLKK